MSGRGPDLARWPAARRTLRRLPMIEAGRGDVEAILARTVDQQLPVHPAVAEGVHVTPEPRAARRSRTYAAAAGLLLAVTGLATWIGPGRDAGFSETELAQLDREVEVALVQLARVLHEAERIAVDDVLGTNAMN